jgi:hypothetical protein
MEILPQKILLLDTETISVNKRFIYDIGYIIAERGEDGLYYAIEKSQYVVDQIYYNEKLFKTAYYEAKRPHYVKLLRSRKAEIKKFGFITQIIAGDLRKHQIGAVFAYNAPFDRGAFDFTCIDFQVKNPFEKITWYDILGIANKFIHLSEGYINFTLENEYFTESGFIETNAEVTYEFISGIDGYKEEHLSLADCEIELAILNTCIANGFEELENLPKQNIIGKGLQNFTVLHDGQEFKFPYRTKRNEPSKNRVVLKS